MDPKADPDRHPQSGESPSMPTHQERAWVKIRAPRNLAFLVVFPWNQVEQDLQRHKAHKQTNQPTKQTNKHERMPLFFVRALGEDAALEPAPGEELVLHLQLGSRLQAAGLTPQGRVEMSLGMPRSGAEAGYLVGNNGGYSPLRTIDLPWQVCYQVIAHLLGTLPYPAPLRKGRRQSQRKNRRGQTVSVPPMFLGYPICAWLPQVCFQLGMPHHTSCTKNGSAAEPGFIPTTQTE